MSNAGKIIELRQLIARHLSAPSPRRNGGTPTGVEALDEALEGGLTSGGMVELVCPEKIVGGSSVMLAMLRHLARAGRWAALIDGRDSFDPQSAGAAVLAHLLWIRCRTADEALRAADLLLRDGNLPLVFLDLRDNAAAELRKTPSTTWYRFQRMLEPTALTLLVLTPRALVPCAQARLELSSSFGLEALEAEPSELLRAVRVEARQRRGFGKSVAFQEPEYARVG